MFDFYTHSAVLELHECFVFFARIFEWLSFYS